MSYTLNRVSVGQVGVTPGEVKLFTADTLATITTAGYLSNNTAAGHLSPTDIVSGFYDPEGIYGEFTVSTVGGLNTLIPWVNPANVETPVIAGRIASFVGTTGKVGDSNNPVTQAGDIHAGLSATAGKFVAYPATAAKGSLSFKCNNNSDDVAITFGNQPFDQPTDITFPDPGAGSAISPLLTGSLTAAGANLVQLNGTGGLASDGLMNSVGYRLLTGTTATWGGGGTTHTFAITNLTTSCRGTIALASGATIVPFKYVIGTGGVDVTFSADPGAGTAFHYNFTTAAAT